MIAALLGGIGWRGWLAIAGAVVVMGLVLVVRAGWHAEGASKALDGVRKANDAVEDKADAASNAVMGCPAGKWNREAGKCER